MPRAKPRWDAESARRRLRALQREYRALTARLARTGPVHDGSVTRQTLKCGKPNCACRHDPQRRHGPYATWTTKVGGKTVSRRLSPEEAALLDEWIENRRELEKVRGRMVALSRKMVPLVLVAREPAEPSGGGAITPGPRRPHAPV